MCDGVAVSTEFLPIVTPTVRPRVVGDPVAEPARETLRLYAGDWRDFLAWCRRSGRTALPAAPQTMMEYLAGLAPTLGRGTLGRRRAAIRAIHQQHGHPVPVLDRAALAELRKIGRSRGMQADPPRARAVRPNAAALLRAAAACPRDLAGLRDRALLLLAACLGAGQAAPDPGVGRHALLGLDYEHVRFVPDGALLHLRYRPDDAEPGRTIVLPRAPAPTRCPVLALEDWLRMSATLFGPVFRKVDRWGNVEHTRLKPGAWRLILARRVRAAAKAR